MATYDIAIYQPPGSGIGDHTQTIFSENGGRAVSGVEKLVQRFVLELLTDKESMSLFPSTGTYLLKTLRETIIYSESQIFTAFASAMVDVENSLKAEETSDTPSDEQFGNALLTYIELQLERIVLTISLLAKDGQSRLISIPIKL